VCRRSAPPVQIAGGIAGGAGSRDTRQMPETRSKAEQFAAYAAALGWRASTRPITHRDYADKSNRQLGWTVIARRDDEVVTATWIDEVAVGPIGWHSSSVGEHPIPNRRSAERIVDGPAA
jgi:hypothetical protein